MSVQTFQLSNGISVYIKTIPASFKVCVDLLVGVGSLCDPPDKKGLAHFVEHMMFRGTKHRGYKQISMDTLKIGGYLNAYTERDATTFSMEVPYRQWEAAIDILLDLYLHPIFPAADLEKERSIIQEEIDMYADIPGEFLMDRFMETLFRGHAMADPILGSKESVDRIRIEDIQTFYEQWYFDQTFTVSIAGRIQADQILPILERKLGSVPLTCAKKPNRPNKSNGKQSIRYDREVDQAQILIGTQAPGLEDPDRVPIQVMNAILGGTEISRLFQRVREEKGLAYAIDAAHEAWLGAGCFFVSVGLDYRKMEEVKSIILEEWEKMRQDFASEEEIAIARNYLEGMKLMSLEGAGAFNAQMGAMAVRGLSADPEQDLSLIRQVTAEDVRRVANRVLDPENYLFAALAPKDEKGRKMSP